MHAPRPSSRAGGFTLVEAIVVIVITGILAGMVAVFIRVPVQSYTDMAARAELADTADLTLRRMNRELRLSLVNTATVTSNPTAIQFLLTKAGGRFLDINDGPTAGQNPLDFIGKDARFDIVGAPPDGRNTIVAGDYIALGNLGIPPADAYGYGTAGSDNISQVASISGNTVTLAANRFATTPALNNRFQVVTGTVTYRCIPGPNGSGQLTRYFTRSIVRTTAVASLGTPALMTRLVSGCNFSYLVLPGQNAGGLVTLSLTLQHPNGERAQLVRQTQLDNF